MERYNHITRKRNDLFGFGDVFAFKNGEFLIVQTTSYSNFCARRRKISQIDAALDWLDAGGTIVVHGWRKVKNRWTCREEIYCSRNDLQKALTRRVRKK